MHFFLFALDWQQLEGSNGLQEGKEWSEIN
jgi:hypothetical protein